jgi:hypothetical protein
MLPIKSDARDGPLGEHEAVFLQLAVDLRRASVILGRPPRGRDFQRQYMRKPAQCQPTTVSG